MPSRYFPFGGGMDLSTTELEVPASRLQGAINYFESIEGGYERVGGYEVFSGKVAPSDTTYHLATFDSWDTHVTDINANDEIVVDSTLTLRILSVDDSVSDTLTAVVVLLDGDIPEDLPDSPLDWDGVSSLTNIIPEASEEDEEHETNRVAAWDYARSQIQTVPGDAEEFGILQVDDTVVAFRNDGSTPKIHYSSDNGWVEGRIGRAVEISAISAVDDLQVGENFDTDDFKIIAICESYDSVGVPVATKRWLVIIPLDTNDAPAVGAHTADTSGVTFTIDDVIQPINAFGSHIQFQNNNFKTAPTSLASYLVDGVNTGMSYLPQYKCLVPVTSNFNDVANETATRVFVRGEHLIFATGEGSFIESEPGQPFNYGGAYGASEIGVGDVITDIEGTDSEHTIFFTSKAARRLTGNDPSNYAFPIAAGNVGSLPRGSAQLDDIFTLSYRGVNSVRRTEAEGGFDGGSVSSHVNKLVKTYPKKFNDCVAIRGREQVRWFADDNRFLVMTRLFDEEQGAFRLSFSEGYYDNLEVKCVSSEVWSDGAERIFATSTDGYVYELEKGRNFNGDEIYAYAGLHANHLGTPGRDKSFKKVFFNTKSPDPGTLTLDFSINSGEKTFNTKDIPLTVEDTLYNVGEFDDATYSTNTDRRSASTLKGRGYNISFELEHLSKFCRAYRITGYTLRYNNLGLAVK